MAKFGRPPSTIYLTALARLRQRQRMRAQMSAARSVFAGTTSGQFVPLNPRSAALSTFTGVHALQSQKRADRAIDRAAKRMAAQARREEEDAAYLASFAAQRPAEPSLPENPSPRPPRPQPGRYDGLKGGEPG